MSEPFGSDETSPAPPDTASEPTAMPETRRLRRSRDDRVIAGVCGGVAEYFGIDAVLVRIATLVLVFAGGAGILLYAIGWITMPQAPETGTADKPRTVSTAAPGERTTGALAIGTIFVLLGAFFLLDEVWSDFLAWQYVWPIALIAVGVAVIVRERK